MTLEDVIKNPINYHANINYIIDNPNDLIKLITSNKKNAKDILERMTPDEIGKFRISAKSAGIPLITLWPETALDLLVIMLNKLSKMSGSRHLDHELCRATATSIFSKGSPAKLLFKASPENATEETIALTTQANLTILQNLSVHGSVTAMTSCLEHGNFATRPLVRFMQSLEQNKEIVLDFIKKLMIYNAHELEGFLKENAHLFFPTDPDAELDTNQKEIVQALVSLWPNKVTEIMRIDINKNQDRVKYGFDKMSKSDYSRMYFNQTKFVDNIHLDGLRYFLDNWGSEPRNPLIETYSKRLFNLLNSTDADLKNRTIKMVTECFFQISD
jgi:hypothetical protein